MTTDPNQLPTGDYPPPAGAGGGGRGDDRTRGVGEQQPGDEIGPYRLISLLGEGGFGAVWLAERRQPFVQQVALKVIKAGMDSKAVIARFEQERQALAVMNHPHVAKVLDGGITPHGRPYFAMEFVKGEPITDFCDRRRLPVRERLAIFTQVCEAVQHAHTKGIIHRDLKPSNVLVGVGDGDTASVKVIDFGVAKALVRRMTEQTIFTETGQMIGTPSYMSPEQAEPDANDIDTRSDVYSLGVILYELLAGVLPFDPGDLRAKAFREIQRIIREEDPPSPSARLSTIATHDAGSAERIAQQRKERVDSLSSILRTELEWIPLKAMRKDRSERYGSPADLARDIGNYLAGRPLLAAPESFSYRARKYIRRHRGPVLAASLVLGALVAGLGLASWQWSVAVVARERAEGEARRSESLLELMTSSIAASDPWEYGSGDETVLDAMERLGRRLAEGVGSGLDLRDQARLHEVIGQVLASSGDESERAIENLRRAAELAAADATLDAAARLRIQHRLVSALYSKGRCKTDDLPEVVAMRTLCEEVSPGCLPLFAATTIAEVQAQSSPERALETLNAARDCWTEEAGFGVERVQSELVRAGILRDLARGDESIVAAKSAVDLVESIPNAPAAWQAQARNALGSAYFFTGRLPEALECIESASKSYAASLGERHPRTLVTRFNLASIAQRAGEVARADALLDELLPVLRSVPDSRNSNTLALSLGLRGRILRDAGSFAAAVPMYRERVEVLQKIHPASSPWIGGALDDLAIALRGAGNCGEALQHTRDGFSIMRMALPAGHSAIGYSARINARVHLCVGDLESARAALAISATCLERASPADRQDHALLESEIAGAGLPSGG